MVYIVNIQPTTGSKFFSLYIPPVYSSNLSVTLIPQLKIEMLRNMSNLSPLVNYSSFIVFITYQRLL